MNTKFISLFTVIATLTGAAFASDCPCKDGNCKKKQRIIYITAHDPENVYGEPVFSDTVISGDAEVVLPEPEPEPVMAAPIVLPEPTLHNVYVGARVGVNMLTWKNKYKAEPAIIDPESDHDDYVFEPVFGGGIFAGHRFDPSWRGDVEFGYMTEFTDTDAGISFHLSTPYLMANAYYDFVGGFYLGGGVGFAFPKVTMDWEYFVSNSSSETKLSFIGGLMAGFGHRLSDRVVLDIRYRIAGFYGPTLTRGVIPAYQVNTGVQLDSLETKTGFILDNSLSMGLRYEF